MLSDIEIAESAQLLDIRKVAETLGLTENELELYGKYKAKITMPKDAKRKAKLILVTAINPTASGEGKTTVSIGLADGMAKIGKKVCRNNIIFLLRKVNQLNQINHLYPH